MSVRQLHRGCFITAFTVLVCAYFIGCGKGPDNQRHVSETKSRLRFACLYYDHLWSEVSYPSTDKPGFTNTQSLVAWMKSNGNADQMQHFLSSSNTTILDAWNQEVLSITDSEGLAGFLSLGKNGRMDSDNGDDIVVTLKESLHSRSP